MSVNSIKQCDSLTSVPVDKPNGDIERHFCMIRLQSISTFEQSENNSVYILLANDSNFERDDKETMGRQRDTKKKTVRKTYSNMSENN